MKVLHKKVEGFTLPELLVVLVIVGILVLLALPSLLPLITKARSTEAKNNLSHIHTLQKTYFYEYSRFSQDLTSIGFAYDGKFVTEGGNINYQLEVVDASNTGYLARATALTDWDGDGVFNTWEIDQEGQLREVQPD